MILKALNNNKLGAYLLMLLFLMVLWINPFFTPVNSKALYNIYPMPLWRGMMTLQNNGILTSILGFVVAAINALLIIRIGSRFSVYNRQTVLPGVVYILLVSLFGLSQHFSPSWIASMAFLLSLNYIFDSHNLHRPEKNCFQAAFILSISSLFYYKMLAVFPLVILALYIMHSLNFRTFFASLIGMVLPWLYLCGYYLWTKGSLVQLSADLQILPERIFYHFELSITHWIVIGVLLLLFLLSMLSLVKDIGTKKIFIRMIYRVIMVAGLYSLSLALITGVSYDFMLILAVPFSLILTHFLDGIKSVMWQNIVFAALLLLTVFSQIYW